MNNDFPGDDVRSVSQVLVAFESVIEGDESYEEKF